MIDIPKIYSDIQQVTYIIKDDYFTFLVSLISLGWNMWVGAIYN